MAITDITSALTQYNANLNWNAQSTTASAQLALEAARFLVANRAQSMNHQETQINYEAMAGEVAKIETFLGATTPRAYGRTRRVGMAHAPMGGLQ